jgi:hypothetical protein
LEVNFSFTLLPLYSRVNSLPLHNIYEAEWATVNIDIMEE